MGESLTQNCHWSPSCSLSTFFIWLFLNVFHLTHIYEGDHETYIHTQQSL